MYTTSIYFKYPHIMYNLPKPYLSPSQYVLWKSSPAQYTKQYFQGQKSFQTKFTAFGTEQHAEKEKEIGEWKNEHRIECTLDCGLKLLGQLDRFQDDLKIIDYKYSKRNAKGQSPWDKVKVRQHVQFPFYNLMVREIHGTYNKISELHWYETELIDEESKTYEYQGHVLKDSSPQKKLVSNKPPVIIPRIIEDWELDKMKDDVRRIAREISEAYIVYKKQNNE